MEDKKDKIKELAQKLEKGIKDVFTSERWKQYLSTAAKFHNYSYGNAMIIWLQRPDATRVAGFTAWRDKFGRTVNKGERGIAILAPVPYKVEHDDLDEKTTETRLTFKVAHVFDVSQTSGRDLPKLIDELQADVTGYGALMDVLKKTSVFPIEFKEIEGGAKGYCSFAEERIVLKQGMSESQTIKTLLHEMAHADLHARNKREAAENPGIDRHTAEVEAESIAYMVGQHLGVDSADYTFGYVAGWSRGKELPELKKSLETIQNHSRKMIEGIDREYEKVRPVQEAQKNSRFDYTEREILWISDAATRSEAIAFLENEMLHVKESLLAEELAGLLQKLTRMADEEFAIADKQRADWE